MEIFDVKDVAKYLNCSISTIRKMVRNKQIPFFRIGYRINFNKQLIDEWVYNSSMNNLK